MENLVGYAKHDLLTLLELDDDPWPVGMRGSTRRAAAWCVEVNAGRRHSEIAAVPVIGCTASMVRWGVRACSASLPSPRPEVGPAPITRKVDKPVVYPVRLSALLGCPTG
ncbi:MAG: hypothetical protein U0R80_00265 [Nocardioidaceae bacterium]